MFSLSRSVCKVNLLSRASGMSDKSTEKTSVTKTGYIGSDVFGVSWNMISQHEGTWEGKNIP